MFQTTPIWTDPKWKELLGDAGLLDIESVSQRDFDWFEAPNKRRGGWSGVSRVVLNPEAPESEQKAVFLKIQQNHFYIAPNTLFRKRLTFEREFDAIRALKPHCDSLPDIVMFATWKENGNRGAILLTESLDGWLPLRPWLLGQHTAPVPDKETLHRAFDAIADTARSINVAGWIHMCFSAKHLFVKEREDGSFDVRIIDLEKTRKRIGLGRRTVKDCSHFMRHTLAITEDDKIHFLKSYFQTDNFTPAQIGLIRRMRGAPKI